MLFSLYSVSLNIKFSCLGIDKKLYSSRFFSEERKNMIMIRC